MTTLAEKIAVMQAAERGEEIQWRRENCNVWVTPASSEDIGFDWVHNIYRVAPEKKPLHQVYWEAAWPEVPYSECGQNQIEATKRGIEAVLTSQKENK